MHAEASLHIDAPPERVWRLITDITRMGQWSPITYKCEWLDGATEASVGARFKGYNKLSFARWWTACEITALEPGRLFEFRTIDGTINIGSRGREMTRWRYEFEPEDIGTRVTEAYDVSFTPALLRIPEKIARLTGGARFVDNRRAKTDRGMEETLQRLKEAAEQ